MNHHSSNTPASRFVVVIGLATVIALIFVVQSYLADSGPAGSFLWKQQITQSLTIWYLWAAFFPLILAIAGKFPFDPGARAKHLVVYLLAGAGIAALHAAIQSLFLDWLFLKVHDRVPLERVLDARFIPNWFWRFFLYHTILAICLALEFYRRARETEIQSAQVENGILRAQIESIKMQVDPDFLFESLNRVSKLIHTDLDDADALIARLGDFLRINLDNAETFDVSLRQEIQFLQCYLDIENIMRRNTAKVELDIDPRILDYRVPNLILQAPVEDAIRRYNGSDPVKLKISVRILDSRLILTILDVVTGNLDPESPRLRQLLKRLNALYQPSVETNYVTDRYGNTTRIEIPIVPVMRNAEEDIGDELPLQDNKELDIDLNDSSNPIGKWLLITIIFTFLSIYFTIQTIAVAAGSGKHVNWPVQLLNCTGWYIWALITPFALKLSSRYPLQKQHFPKHLMIHFFGFAAAWFSANLAFAAVRWAANLGQSTYFSQLGLARTFGLDIICYSTIVAIESAIRYNRRFESGKFRAVRLSAELARARLQALKMQLHPHFLFNALNSLSQLMQEDPDAAEEMIVNLERFLRLTLNSNDLNEISLEEELEFLKCYLAIENIRFQDRLTIKMEIEPEALEVLVPNLVLQPIVENAIKHGVAPRSSPGEVNIRATRKNGVLTVSVRDDGPGLNKSRRKLISARPGLGLSNTQERLVQLYGNSHRFELINAPEGGLVVTVEIPVRFHRRA